MIADAENDGDRGPTAIVEPTTREKRIVAVLDVCAALDANDLAIMAWIAERLPVSKLRERCAEITELGRCGPHAPNEYTPTPREHVAHAALLGAVNDISVAIHGRGLRG